MKYILMAGFSGILDRIDKIVKELIQKKKKARLMNTKEKYISNWFSTKKKHYKINEFSFCSV